MTQMTMPPGFRQQDAQNATTHLRYQRREARRDKVVSRGSLLLNVLLGGALLACAYGAAFVLPLVRLVPVFTPTNTDGTTLPSVTTDQQPPDLSQRQIRAWLWQYVVAHDSYAFGSAFYNRDVVKGMSTPEVFNAFKAYVDGPNGNMNRLGHTNWVRLVPESGDLRLSADGSGTYRQTYYRVQEGIGKPSVTTHWRQDIAFTQSYAVPLIDGTTKNPSSLTVTEYPPPEPLVPQPGGVTP